MESMWSTVYSYDFTGTYKLGIVMLSITRPRSFCESAPLALATLVATVAW